MRWLIVEDALRDRRGHWFEYLATFTRELRGLGDDVTLLADCSAEPFLVDQLQVQRVLPASIWHRMGDGAGSLRRYARVPAHAWKTYWSLEKYFQRAGGHDIIFVPTVLVHHLLGWAWLIKWTLKKSPSRVVLFFPNTPIELDPKTQEPAWLPAPTARLFCRLVRSLSGEVRQARVVLGAETEPMRAALTKLTGVPFTYFPHPVPPAEDWQTEPTAPSPGAVGDEIAGQSSRPLTMSSFGSARHEKGSDVLVSAVEEYCRRYPASRVRFVLQSVDGDKNLWRRLEGNPKVRLVPEYFADGEYARHLRATDVLLLPYRCSSYGLRVSRVVIEAMMQGIPVVATRGTTLASQAGEFGAAVLCEDGDIASLVAAIHDAEQRHGELKHLAGRRQPKCIGHFSVRQFRATALGGQIQ